MKHWIKIALFATLLFQTTFASAHSTDDPPQSIPGFLGSASMGLAQKHIGLQSGWAGTQFTLDRSNAEYAAFVDQGVAMLNMFHYIDALRSFREADALNPSSLLPAAGMIISYVHLDPSAGGQLAKELIAKKDAELGSLNPSRQDLLWYELAKGVYTRYTGGSSSALSAAYQALTREFPEDQEVLSLAAWLAGNYRIATYDRAMAINPRNVGAAHYLTHILESSGDFAGAVKYAEIVAEDVTSSAHAQHMLGHLLPHLKRWSEANVQFEKAHQIHMNWAKENQVGPSEDWHYSHNLNLWSVSLAGVGQIDKALEMMTESCQFDGRACLDLMEASIGAGRLTYFDQIAAALPGQFAPYIVPYTAESSLLRGTKSIDQAANDLRALGELAQVLTAIYRTAPGSAGEAALAQNVAPIIRAQTMEAGFDSWGAGFFAGLRISQAAKRQGLTQVNESAMATILEVAPEFSFDVVNYAH